jgi:hypothetical protein
MAETQWGVKLEIKCTSSEELNEVGQKVMFEEELNELNIEDLRELILGSIV